MFIFNSLQTDNYVTVFTLVYTSYTMPGPSTFALVDQARNNLKKLESFITTGMDNCEDLTLDIVENGKGLSH